MRLKVLRFCLKRCLQQLFAKTRLKLVFVVFRAKTLKENKTTNNIVTSDVNYAIYLMTKINWFNCLFGKIKNLVKSH